MTAPAQTLSSHISIISKRNSDNTSNNSFNKNNAGGSSQKGNGKNKPNRDRSRQNGASAGRDQRKNNHPNKTRRNNEMPTSGRHHPTSNRPAQEQKTNEPRKVANLEPFELFCAYHLGIGPNKQYKPSNINEVANRFRQEPGIIRQALKEYGMDSASLLDRDFDMALAQLDIQVAPEGVDRTELAKNIYEEYLESPHQKRDWKKILEEDRKQNRKIFGG
jgi:hypothetical protein